MTLQNKIRKCEQTMNEQFYVTAKGTDSNGVWSYWLRDSKDRMRKVSERNYQHLVRQGRIKTGNPVWTQAELL